MTKDEIYSTIKTTLVETFGLDAVKVRPEARLFEDLDLDSIDAVDLSAQLHAATGKRIAQDDFKAVRTIQDVVEAVQRSLLAPTSEVASSNHAE